ncbi:MAG: reverse transcriptase family protein [Candidatus Thiodiazotropha endolucinida]|nr:reverse transcriptase family protein [Candidatus Thiodiazotropha taylori]MCW4264087.1 reverse transcriptase family protein [Candidatus Thiodiazotropha endolucinida]
MEIEDSNEIVNEFNKFFVSIASHLKEPIQASNFDRLETFCSNKVPEDTFFTIPEISIEKITKFLTNIDTTKATGCDFIGPRLLKMSAPFIADSIAYICNQSITKSQFPDAWKEAKVTPLQKSGPKDDINNYRPISILPVISKVLEKHIHDSLMNFLTEYQLLQKTQSGFRPNHSCETALVGMICRWLESINQGSLIGAVMVDFKKAFDLVDHAVLLKKLKHYRLSSTTISWFSSYLNNRRQKVSLHNAMSKDAIITDGVLQGSILGPLLFLLFINDLPLYTESSNTDMYADDTTLYVCAKSHEDIQSSLQMALDSLAKWCTCNGMIINTTKTKAMLITTHQKRATLTTENLSLTLNSVDLNMISNDKILGVMIDNNLTWTHHIDKICKKMASNLWLLSRIKTFLSREHRIQFYKTYIQPHIDYCNIIWGGTSQMNLNRVFRLQKRACKIILDYNVENILESMKDLKILTIFDRLYLRKAKFMYKISIGEIPQYVNEMFQKKQINENEPQLRSASGQTFITPKPNKEIFKQSIAYSGPIIWNCLPPNLRSVENINIFHSHFIKWILGPRT